MTDFLTTIPHLNETQRSTLRSHDLDTADAIVAFTVESLSAATGLTLGSAGKLLTAAKRALDSGTPQGTLNIDAKHEAMHRACRAALEAVAENPLPHRVKALADYRIGYAVVVDGKLHVDMTRDLTRDIEGGAPVPRLWQGHRVVPVADLVAPAVLWHPRTGKPLQAGKDEFGIAWADLGIDVLRLLTYGYNIDAFHGMTDAAVFEQGKLAKAEMSPMLANLKRRAVAERINLERINEVHPMPSRNDFEQAPPRAVPTTGSPVSRLAGLFLNMFSADELRRFIRYMPGGNEIDGLMPGSGVSAMQVAHAAADLLHRHGHITRALRDRLVVDRPRRAEEIDAFFTSVL